MVGSNTIKSQIDRCNKFTNQVTKASKEGSNLVICIDHNIYSLGKSNSSNILRYIELYHMKDDMIIEND